MQVVSLPHPLPFFFLSWTEEPTKVGTCAHDRRALQQLALNVHVKHSDPDHDILFSYVALDLWERPLSKNREINFWLMVFIIIMDSGFWDQCLIIYVFMNSWVSLNAEFFF